MDLAAAETDAVDLDGDDVDELVLGVVSATANTDLDAYTQLSDGGATATAHWMTLTATLPVAGLRHLQTGGLTTLVNYGEAGFRDLLG